MNELDTLRRLNVFLYANSLVIYRMLLVRLRVRNHERH